MIKAYGNNNIKMKHGFFVLAILPLLFLLVIHVGKQIFPNFSLLCLATEGVGNAIDEAIFVLKNLFFSDDCEQTYGFLPCSTAVAGNIFLILAYGYLMFQAAKVLSEGCEILLEILGPGIIGGLVLPILSALPDAIVILASGLSGSKETAQDQVSVGMGLLAGSIVMLLTLLWGSCVIVGKCDLEDANAKDELDTKGFSLTGSGVSTDIWTTYAARIMVLSVTPFIIVQLPQVLNTTTESRLFILTALVLSIAFLISYCLYQDAYSGKNPLNGWVFQSLDVNKDGNLSAEELRALIVGIRFDEVDVDAEDIDDAVKSILQEFDKTDDSLIDEEEFANGISNWIYQAKRSAKYAGNQCPDSDSPHLKFLSEFYQNQHTGRTTTTSRQLETPPLDKTPLCCYTRNWKHPAVLDPVGASWKGTGFKEEEENRGREGGTPLLKTREGERRGLRAGGGRRRQWRSFLSPSLGFPPFKQTRKERDLLGDSSDEDEASIKNPKWNAFKAVMMLLLGTAAVCVFANPLVDAVNNFSSATKVPTFFVSFVVLPFASCSEGVSALIFIRNKKHKTASLTFSQIYGSVTMSNILSLSVFLGLVYIRELTWSFSLEVLVILIVCILMGVFASFRTTFPLWTCLVAFSLYPLSVLLVYVFEYIVTLS
ncbi:hypothetical protein Vadar_004030 [Vaccinium darrowii]|uniref:Uncharacterized protein n=1 Tax=Vaccinium darrowii TaxID=229202 RepID=A0ACB7XN06_9ERIC|nr:hypothetical protein Vadar_004030 [Vaccinium darrowii]